MARAEFIAAAKVLCLFLSAASAQAQSVRAPNRIEDVRALSKQLQWHDEPSHREYERTRDAVTRRLLAEIDGFIAESFQPATATPGRVEARLAALLGYPKAASIKNVAFSVDLRAGHFLVVGIDLWRGGGAIPEDAISVRAYKQNGDRFALIAHIDDLHSSDPGNPFLAAIDAKPLSSPPVPDEFWFVASAITIPSQAPPKVAVRLYAFDGAKFRTVWGLPDFMAEGPEQAVQLTTGGFITNKLFDPTGQAAHSPTVVIHEQYVLTPGGPQKTNQWETQRQ